MSELGKAVFKRLTGKQWDLTRRSIPKVESVRQDVLRGINSEYPLVKLGHTAEYATFNITEEERTHTHILGLPGEGKSKFIELLCRHDIDRLRTTKGAPGLCLIDSSDFGNTYKKVLRYCRKSGFTKVALVDPNDGNSEIGKFPTISIYGKFAKDAEGKPHYQVPRDAAASRLRDPIRILWESDSYAGEARINRNLRILAETIHSAGATLADLVYFTEKYGAGYESKRGHLMSFLKDTDDAKVALENFFYHQPPHTFAQEFGSVIRRLDPLFEGPLPFLIGSNSNPMDFRKLMANGWIILCNLDPRMWDIPQQRFLGTLIINEVIQAQYDLTASGRSVPFYLYIDEVGRYATETLASVIDYKRTANLKLIMAHQRFAQIKNKVVLDALASARIKVLFYAQGSDREQMLRQMYYGSMEKQANEVFHDIEKQHAIIKVGKVPPRKIRLLDVPDVPTDKEGDDEFKRQLYRHPWYKTKDEVLKEMRERFTNAQGERGLRLKVAGKPKGKSPNKRDGNASATEPKARRDTTSPKRARAVPDDKATGSAFLLRRKGRKAEDSAEGEGKKDEP